MHTHTHTLMTFPFFQPGEYFVVGVDVEQYDAENPGKYLTGMLSNKPDPILEKAFRSFFSVVPTPPRGFKNFSVKVNEYMEKPPFLFPNPLVQLGGVKQVILQLCIIFSISIICYVRAENDFRTIDQYGYFLLQ